MPIRDWHPADQMEVGQGREVSSVAQESKKLSNITEKVYFCNFSLILLPRPNSQWTGALSSECLLTFQRNMTHIYCTDLKARQLDARRQAAASLGSVGGLGCYYTTLQSSTLLIGALIKTYPNIFPLHTVLVCRN